MLIYLSLGSNLGPSVDTIERALRSIEALAGIHSFQASSLYRTSPISPIPQAHFINAVCCFETTLTPSDLYNYLHRIEVELGKIAKPKEAPRIIDIDILLFGALFLETPELIIPHPRWQERLFVLLPLQELTKSITYPLNAQGQMRTTLLDQLIEKISTFAEERLVVRLYAKSSLCQHLPSICCARPDITSN